MSGTDGDGWGGYVEEPAPAQLAPEQPGLPTAAAAPPAEESGPSPVAALAATGSRALAAAMTRQDDSIEIPVPLHEAMLICRAAAPDVKAKVKAEGPGTLRFVRRFGLMRNLTEFDLALAETSPGRTTIAISGGIVGFGPLVKRQLRGDIEALKTAIARGAR